MQKNHLTLSAVIFGLLLGAACSKSSYNLEGVWVQKTTANDAWQIQFLDDGQVQAVNPQLEIALNGRYTQTNGVLLMEITKALAHGTPLHKQYNIKGDLTWTDGHAFSLALNDPGPISSGTGTSLKFEKTDQALASIGSSGEHKETTESAEKTEAKMCAQNLKNVQLAMSLYMEDNGALPPAEGWSGKLTTYSPNLLSSLTCPSLVKSGGSFGYALNSELALAQKEVVADPAKKPLLFEVSVLKEGYSCPPTEMMTEPRHDGRIVVAFMDGHIDSIEPSQSPDKGDKERK